MPTRRSQAERRDETRARLVAAGAEVFARRGYRDATVAEIAREAGCSTGALYVHFPGKHELFLELFDAELVDWAAGYTEAVSGGRTVDDIIAAAGRHWSEQQDHNASRTMLFVEFWCAAMRDPQLRAEFAGRHAHVRAAIGGLIGAGRASSGVATELSDDALGSIVTALADGFALQRLADPAAVPDDLFATALRLVLGLGGGAPR